MVGLPYDSWIVIIKDVKYKVNEDQFYGLLLSKLISWGNLVSYGGLKDDHGSLVFQPLCKIAWLNKIALSILVRSRNQKEGEERDLFNKKYVSLIEDPNDLHALKFLEVLDNGVQCDVLDVQEKGVQVDSHNEKVFARLEFKPMIFCVLVIRLKE